MYVQAFKLISVYVGGTLMKSAEEFYVIQITGRLLCQEMPVILRCLNYAILAHWKLTNILNSIAICWHNFLAVI